MNCPSCGGANPEDKRFCGDCGAPLPVRCRACGSENPQGKNFCGDCGAGLAADGRGSAAGDGTARQPPGYEAERREITVLFCDLVGSTALSTRLDPEDLRDVIGAYHKCAAHVVARFEGFVAEYMGDGILAYFGYPRAHEDDAERAVRAGLALVEAVGRLQVSERLRTRVGIGTGLVVVGDLVGTGEMRKSAAVGETPNLAARLQALAPPDGVVIAESTRLLSGALFEYEDLGAVEAKGFSEPVHAWRVLGEGAVDSQFEALHAAALTPLVGREEEIELLLRRWERAKAGDGQVVLLSGEPGIGKSRLMAAFHEKICGETHTRLRYFCSPHHRESALFPFIMQLQRAAGFSREDTPQVKLDKLATLLASTPSPDEDMALFAELLSIPANDRCSPLNFTPQRKKEMTFAALLRQFEALARQSPVLMTFEDAHWSDPTSRDLLDLTVERVPRLPVLLLFAFRPELAPAWTGQAHVTAMMLSRLNKREGANLVGRIIGKEALPNDVVDQIVARADGVPLYIEELTKALLEVTGVGRVGNRSTAEPVPRPLIAVPSTLNASLMARLDQLGLAAKEVAQVGSVIGREFAYEILVALALFPDEEKLRDALRQLAAAGLIVQRGQPPFASYLFKHALLQDAAYGSLLRGKRQQIHAAVRRVLEESTPEVVEAQPELLAFHCMEAGLVREAIDYWERAGHRAALRSANREAAGHFRKALDLLERLPESEERDRRELNLLVALGPTLMATMASTAPEVASTYTRASELAGRTGRSAELFPTLWGAHLVAAVAGDSATADKLVAELFAIARALDDRDLLLQAHHAAFRGTKAAGDLASAQRHAEAVLEQYDPERHSTHALIYGAHDPGSCARIGVALTMLLRGYPDQSRRHAEQALTMARGLPHPPSLAHVLRMAGDLHILRREFISAADVAADFLPLTLRHGSAVGTANGTMLRGWARTMQGHITDGVEEVREGLHLWRQTGSKLDAPFRLGVAADALAAAGHLDDAWFLLNEAIEATELFEERWFKAELHRMQGALMLRWRSEGEDAEACFQQALTVARRQDARLLELRAAGSLARLWRNRDRCADACNLLGSIHERFTEGFATPDLQEAGMLLDELRAGK